MRPSRKDLILSEAIRLFSEKGYHATSVRDIAEAVGMSKAGLYSSFTSKDDLLEAIYYSIIDDMLNELSAIVSIPDRPSAKLRRAIAAQVIGTAQHIPEMTIYYRERQNLPEPAAARIAEKRRAYERMMESIISEGIAVGEFSPVDIPVTTFGIVGMCAWTYRWFNPGGRMPAEDIARLYADIIIRGLCKMSDSTSHPSEDSSIPCEDFGGDV